MQLALLCSHPTTKPCCPAARHPAVAHCWPAQKRTCAMFCSQAGTSWLVSLRISTSLPDRPAQLTKLDTCVAN